MKASSSFSLILVLAAFLRPPQVAAAPRYRDAGGDRKTKRLRVYRDADGDGRGAGRPLLIAAGSRAPAGYASLGGDCDDTDPRVEESRADLLPDCDENAAADEPTPQTVCVGKPMLFFWHDAQGALNATVQYRDALGRAWIDAASCRRTADGALLVIPGRCTDR